MIVKILQSKGRSVLVEWVEENIVRRAYVPSTEVTTTASGEIQVADPGTGIPFGEYWEEHLAGLRSKATPEAIAQELRRLGIWDYEDLVQNPMIVISAFQAVYGMDAQMLREAARVANERKVNYVR